MDLIEEVTGTGTLERLEGKRIKKQRLEELDNLVEVINMASHLNNERKNLYVRMAELYTKNNFRENLFKDQFRLSTEFPETTYDEWNMFLNDRLVKTYLDRHKRTLMLAGANENLLDPTGKNKLDNLNLIKSLEEKEKNYSNQQVVIMRLPDKYE